MTDQQGAALVIVMALLSGALMIGISAMNSALIDERLAGNYRAMALAQMNAEQGASQLDQSDLEASVGACQALVDDYETFESWGDIAISELSNGGLAKFVTCRNSGEADVLLIMGSVEGASAVSFITRSFGGSSGNPEDIDINDFFDWLIKNIDEVDGEQVCNADEFSGNGPYYCSSSFYDGKTNKKIKLDSGFSNKILISDNDIEFQVSGSADNLILITPGEVIFSGLGSNDSITGFVWSGDGLTINGAGGQDLGICAPKDTTVNGGSLANDSGCDSLEKFLKDNFGYESESGSSGTGWAQL